MKIIIVGAGLAGLSLAHELERENIDFKLIDEGVNYSTKVAAGMINPMTFRRMIKTWKGDEVIAKISKYYPELEKKLNQNFFFPRKLRRAFASAHEKQLWEERIEEDSYKTYLEAPLSENDTPDHINAPFGSGYINTPGYVDAKIFMKANHDYFLKENKLEYASFSYTDLDSEAQIYKGEKYSHLIFCEGYRGEDNPYFGYLPFKNAKGEVLTVASSEFDQSEIINKKCFVLPLEDGTFKLGATYAWNTKDPSPTQAGKKELLEKYKALSTADFSILKQEGGIRPAVADRRPLLGEHPKKSGLYIFNGFGAKGYLLVPHFVEIFINYLIRNVPLEKEVDIQRFFKKHFNEKNQNKE